MNNENAIKILEEIKETQIITDDKNDISALDHAIKALKYERPHGKWIYDYLGYMICSECGYECLYDEEGLYSLGCYCHHCGADMRGDENGEIK